MKRLERMRWNGVTMRPKHKPRRGGRMSVLDQLYLPEDEGLPCHHELHMVYRVDHISIIKGRTRLMRDLKLEVCMAEMRKVVCTAPKPGQVRALEEEQYNMTISMIDSRHNRLPPGMKRRAEEVEVDQEVINEVRVGSVEEVVDVVMGGVGMGIAEMSDPIKGHQVVHHQAIRTSNPSSTNLCLSNINNPNNNTLNIRTINNPSIKTRTRTIHISNSRISLSRLLWTRTAQINHTNPLPTIISNPLHSNLIPNSSIPSSSSCHNQVDPPLILDLPDNNLQI
jgi:hypothetical protein